MKKILGLKKNWRENEINYMLSGKDSIVLLIVGLIKQT